MRRSLRIAGLLAAVGVMSAADLYMTLVMVTTVGFAEENPIARAVIGLGSPTLLALWKIGTVGIATALLLRLRKHAAAELGAWASAALMVGVMMHWHAYNAEAGNLTRALHLLESGIDERWIAMTPP